MKTKNESNQLAKECIVTALIELMKVRDFHSITITELTQKAGVSRMAYYRNYTSKEDIFNKFIDEVGASIHQKSGELRSEGDVYGYFFELFTQLDAYKELTLIAEKADLGELILAQINKNMALTFACDEHTPLGRYRHRFIAGAFYNILISWLKSGQQESVADMARLCCSLACEGCHFSFLQGGKDR